MNLRETAQLLRRIAHLDNRRPPDDEALETWHDLMAPLDYDDARRAVAEHYATSGEYLRPIHIVNGVKRIRARRLEQSVTNPPPPGLADDTLAARRYLQQQIKAIADGRFVNKVLALPPGARRQGPPPDEWQNARADMAGTDRDDEAAEVRRAALAVGCPHCHALPGKPCTLAGTREPVRKIPAHEARIEAAGGGQAGEVA